VRKIAEVLLSLGRTPSPLKGSTYSWASKAFNAAQDADNPFLSHEQSSQPEQEKSSCEGNVLSPARFDSSSDDSDSSSDDSDSSSDTSPDTSPTKPACTPKKSVAKPTYPILSLKQFFSSPSQAVLERLIPFLDEQNGDSDDVVGVL
jgi:cytoskeletal protein RodZ